MAKFVERLDKSLKMINGSRLIYLAVLLPLAYIAWSFGFPQYAEQKVQDALLQEKAATISGAVEMIAAGIEAEPGRTSRDILPPLVAAVEHLDNQYEVYAAVYKADASHGQLPELISGRHAESSPFEPFEFPALEAAIYASDHGSEIIGYEPDGRGYRDLHVYYRWAPLYAEPDDRYLVIAGVSEHSVVSDVPLWINVGPLVDKAVPALLVFIFSIFNIRLSHVYARQRKEEAARGDCEVG